MKPTHEDYQQYAKKVIQICDKVVIPEQIPETIKKVITVFEEFHYFHGYGEENQNGSEYEEILSRLHNLEKLLKENPRQPQSEIDLPSEAKAKEFIPKTQSENPPEPEASEVEKIEQTSGVKLDLKLDDTLVEECKKKHGGKHKTWRVYQNQEDLGNVIGCPACGKAMKIGKYLSNNNFRHIPGNMEQDQADLLNEMLDKL